MYTCACLQSCVLTLPDMPSHLLQAASLSTERQQLAALEEERRGEEGSS